MTDKHKLIVRIAQNGMVAAFYYGLTMLMMAVPVISQFGMMQCRFSEVLVLFAFFRPDLTIGLTIGCFFANLTGALTGLGFPQDMLFGTLATLLACGLEAYASPRLAIACLWPVIANSVIVGAELYYFFDGSIPMWIQMGWVALGELIAIAVGYAIFMLLIRNRGFMKYLMPTRHAEVKW